MVTTLLLALAQSAAIATGGANPRPVAPSDWPVQWMEQRCPDFTDDNFPNTTVSDIAECQITEWGEFATFERATYYYVLYCVVLNTNKAEDGACADPSSVSARYGAANAAVFVRENNSPTVRLVISKYTGNNGAVFEKPLLVPNEYGAIMQLTMSFESSCYCNNSTYYFWRRNARQWQDLDWEGWQKNLDRRLPRGLKNQNGFWPNLESMTTTGSLWRKDDPHCCPSGGTVDVQLGISGNRFTLKSLKLHLTQAQKQE
jgi:hypothetical protein